MSSSPFFSFSGAANKAIPLDTIRSSEIELEPNEITKSNAFLRSADRTEGRKNLMKHWHILYERLKAYQKEHGHLHVTAEDPEKDLYVWVENLRNNKDTLSRRKQELLTKVGFPWKVERRTQWDFIDNDIRITRVDKDHDNNTSPLSAATINEVQVNGDNNNDEEEPKQKKTKFDHPYCTVQQKQLDAKLDPKMREETKIDRPNSIRNCDTTDDDGTVGFFVISDQASYSKSVDHPYCTVQQKERVPKIESKLREERKIDRPNTIRNYDTTDDDGTVDSFVISDQATYAERDDGCSNNMHDDDTADSFVASNEKDILDTIITFSTDQDDNIKNSKSIQENYSYDKWNKNEMLEINLVVTNHHPSSPVQSKKVKTITKSRTFTIIHGDDDTVCDDEVCEEFFDTVPIESEDWI